MSQYLRESWGPERRFPEGPVYAFAQTADGYLWVGAEAGLVCFDGNSFLTISVARTQTSPPQPLGPVLGLAVDDQGNLWVRLRGLRVLRYRDGSFFDPMPELELERGGVTFEQRTKVGDVLFALANRGPVMLRGRKLQSFAGAESLPDSPVISLAHTKDGDVWAGTRDYGLFHWHNGVVNAVTQGLPDVKINCLLSTVNGELWIGTDKGIVRWNGREVTKAGLPLGLEHVQALSMTEDRDSNIWVGTAESGLLRVNASGVSSLEPRAGPAVNATFEDREGNLWFGGTNGIERIRDSAFATYSTAEGMPSDNPGPVYADSQNRIWFGTRTGGLYSLKAGKITPSSEANLKNDIVYSIAGGESGLWIGRQRGGLTQLFQGVARTYTQADGLAQNTIFAVSESRDGSVWAGTLNEGVSHFHNGRFTNYRATNGLASNIVSSILESADGTMWFATPSGLSSLSNNHWRTYTAADGLPSENVNCLFEDSTGTLWIGTLAGIAFMRSGNIKVPASPPVALREQIFGITEDKNGSLWISTGNHTLRVNRERLGSSAAIRAIGEGDYREYELADGLYSMGGVKRHRSVVADLNGGVWFSMTSGLSVARTTDLASRSVPAIAQIEMLLADGNPVTLSDSVRVPAGKQRITFNYAGLSLAIPERTRFRYRLDGFDHGWSDPVVSREAIYTNLAPGPYRFRVIASDLDGVFNSAESTLAFRIEPLFWQSAWFGMLTILALGCFLVALVRFRTKRLTQQLDVRFEERIAERTRIAQELHDTLLQGFLSASMQLSVAADRVPEETPLRQSLNKILNLMSRVIGEGRNAVHDLRLADVYSLDLEQAFSRIQEEFAVSSDTKFHVIVEGRLRPLHPILRDEVYRIGREALVNAFRHAHASRVEVELEYSAEQFRVLVRDNGCGIDPVVLQSGREGHWGLSGMRERSEKIGARLRVWSGASTGTEIELSVPAAVAFKTTTRTESKHWYSGLFSRNSGSERK